MLIFLCAVLVLAGAAGLVSESVWIRSLDVVVGHGAGALALGLAVVLAGVSVGALLVGRRAERIRNPLRWLALVELALGLAGLALRAAVARTTGAAYDSPLAAHGPGSLHVVATAVAGLLIFPQAALLGAAFPLMVAGAIRRRPERAGRTIALLYGAGSLGAAGGVLAAGFDRAARSNVPGALLAVALTNLVVGVAVLLASRGAGWLPVRLAVPTADVTPPIGAAEEGGIPRPLVQLMFAVTAGTAISSVVYGIGWLRMLSLVLGATTHSLELMLSAFLLGLAIGAFVIRRRNGSSRRTLQQLAHVQLAMAALAVATLPVYVLSLGWTAALLTAFTREPAGYVAFGIACYAICLGLMLPATICAGMTLPLVTRFLLRGADGERAIGRVYAANALGWIAGATLAALGLLPLLGLTRTIVAGAVLDVALGAWLLAVERRGARDPYRIRRWLPVLGATLIVAAVAACCSPIVG